MDRISGANYVLIGGKREWQDRNLQNGVNGTFGNAAWFNGTQESILGPVEAAGLIPTDADNTQLLQAIKLIAGQGLAAYYLAGGFTFVPPPGWFGCHAIVIGGGGGSGSGGGGGGGGGGSGGLAWKVIGCTPGVPITGIVGAGGAANGPGGTSSFAGISATGGTQGSVGSRGGAGQAGGAGQGAGGNLNLLGTLGEIGTASSELLLGGKGGGSLFGGGGVGAIGNSTQGFQGTPGPVPGSGGGGSTLNVGGALGAPGCVLIWR